MNRAYFAAFATGGGSPAPASIRRANSHVAGALPSPPPFAIVATARRPVDPLARLCVGRGDYPGPRERRDSRRRAAHLSPSFSLPNGYNALIRRLARLPDPSTGRPPFGSQTGATWTDSDIQRKTAAK